jgi:hypothetical protein
MCRSCRRRPPGRWCLRRPAPVRCGGRRVSRPSSRGRRPGRGVGVRMVARPVRVGGLVRGRCRGPGQRPGHRLGPCPGLLVPACLRWGLGGGRNRRLVLGRGQDRGRRVRPLSRVRRFNLACPLSRASLFSRGRPLSPASLFDRARRVGRRLRRSRSTPADRPIPARRPVPTAPSATTAESAAPAHPTTTARTGSATSNARAPPTARIGPTTARDGSVRSSSTSNRRAATVTTPRFENTQPAPTTHRTATVSASGQVTRLILIGRPVPRAGSTRVGTRARHGTLMRFGVRVRRSSSMRQGAQVTRPARVTADPGTPAEGSTVLSIATSRRSSVP